MVVVDSHVHLWDPGHFAMPWLADNPVLGRPFGLTEYAEHTRGANIQAFVYLEVDVAPEYALLEARWAVERAREDVRLQAVVAHAPVEHGEQVRAYLDELKQLGPLIKGVRRLIQGEPDPAFCARPGFVRGVQILADYDLSFDACVVHPQLPALLELVRQCPHTRIVLDHLGKPAIRDGVMEPWRRHISQLAAYPNVWCKISGAVTEADHAQWLPADLAPYIEHVIDAFGEDRVMFGGDWPVVLMASPYAHWLQTLRDLSRGVAQPDKLWADNARGFYRMDR